MVSLPSRITLPALAALLSLTLTSPALADAPALADEIALAATFETADAAVAQAPVMDELEAALMNSPLHRKNILEPRFTRLAVGAVRGPDGKLIYAQIFR